MFEELLTELSAGMQTFAKRYADAEHVRAALAIGRQRRLAMANARIVRRRGAGGMVLRRQYDSEVYHRLAHKHGGYQVVNSRDFEEWAEKRMPEEFPRLQHAADHVTVRVEWEGGRRSEVGGQEEVSDLRPPTSDLRPPPATCGKSASNLS